MASGTVTPGHISPRQTWFQLPLGIALQHTIPVGLQYSYALSAMSSIPGASRQPGTKPSQVRVDSRRYVASPGCGQTMARRRTLEHIIISRAQIGRCLRLTGPHTLTVQGLKRAATGQRKAAMLTSLRHQKHPGRRLLGARASSLLSAAAFLCVVSCSGAPDWSHSGQAEALPSGGRCSPPLCPTRSL